MTIYRCPIDPRYSSYENLKKRHVVAQGWSSSFDVSFFIEESDIYRYLPVFAEDDDLGKVNTVFRVLTGDVRPGDIFIATIGGEICGICEIPENFTYVYLPDDEYANCLFPVNWIDWATFCPDFTQISNQRSRGPLTRINNSNVATYVNEHWVPFKSHNSIVVQLEECQSDLEKYLRERPEKIRQSKQDFQGRLRMLQKKADLEVLKRCLLIGHNLVLTGAPGTGKTYLAKQIASQMIFGETMTPEEIERTPEHKKKFDNQCTFVQFHPSYDYTDFVEGLRPAEQDDGSIGFQRQDGIFKKFCKSALETEEISDNFEEVYSKFKSECEEDECLEFYTEKLHKKFTVTFNSKLSCVATPQTGYGSKMQMKKEWFRDYLRNGVVRDWKPYLTVVAEYMREKYNYTKSVNKAYDNDSSNGGVEQPFVFIIDEINRGDIAKIFGELFFAIDPGYRGIKGRIKTQYNGLVDDDDCFKEGFYVPRNVYIIGTMNDIDRNVESMDFAIRRRFTWKEITPDENLSMWDNEKNGIPEYKDQARTTMEKINASIIDMAGDGLGPQYQLGAAYFLKLKEYDGDFNKLWDWHIAPLLREYLRGTPEADKHFNNLRDVWFASLSPKQNLSAESSEQMAPK